MAAKPHLKIKVNNHSVKLNTVSMNNHFATGSENFGYGFNSWLPNPDPILKKLGLDIDVYDELLSDSIVGSHVRRRKASVAGLQWNLDTENVLPKISEIIDNVISNLDIYDLVKNILNAPFFGYQPLEIIWSKDSLWLPDSIVAKPQKWFNFSNDRELQYIGTNLNGEVVPPYKFLCPTHEASYLNPYGRPDLSMVFWPTTFKRAGLKFWAEFTEKYGAPWVIGKEPRSNTDKDTAKLLDALEALIGNSVGTIPLDSSVEIKEASGKASSVDAYDKLIKMCRSEIAIALLGQDQTTEKDSTNASAQAGLEVTKDIRDSDKRIVESIINKLINYICELNFNESERPKFILYEEKTGSSELAVRDKTLWECGIRFSKSYYQRTYNLADSDIDSLNIQTKTTTSSPSSNFSESNNKNSIIESFIPNDIELVKQGTLLTDSLILALKHGTEPIEVLECLTSAYPDMDDTALQNELARLIFISDLVGRIEVTEELHNEFS